MRVIHMTATAGTDGQLRLDIPTAAAGGTFEVAVVLHTLPTASDTESHPPAGSLASLYGCITDDTFVAPPRGLPRPVPPLDSD
jgi:hypothetical protein